MTTINKNYSGYRNLTKEQMQRRSITLCPQCGDAKYDGHWHTSNSWFALGVDGERDVINYGTCTGCQKELDKVSRGILYVNNVPRGARNRVVAHIQQEILQDCFERPQHKILDFVYTATGYMITANNAATTRRIARELEDVFEVSDVKSTYQRLPHVRQLIEVEFIPTE